MFRIIHTLFFLLIAGMPLALQLSATDITNKNSSLSVVETTFRRGDSFLEAIEQEWPGDWKLDEGTVDDLDLVPITTYVYDPNCDLWWQPCDVQGSLYPGDHLFVTYRVDTGTPVDSVMLNIPAKGENNIEQNVIYRAAEDSIDEVWTVITDYYGFDYYGYNWIIFDESNIDDGLWPVSSKIYIESSEFSDLSYIILDSEDPQYHITYTYHNDPQPLPTILHPTLGQIPITNAQLVDIHIQVDQTVVDDLPGNGRLWSWMSIFIHAPGEEVDIDCVPACGDDLFPCGPGEDADRWMNEPPFVDSTDYHYTWNVQNADETSEGEADVRIKGRDTAGNLVDVGIEDVGASTGLKIFIDVTPPSTPDESLITVCDDGRIKGEAGAVEQDQYGQPLKVILYNTSQLTEKLFEFFSNINGSFSVIVDQPLTIGTEIFVTAMDRAGNESETASVTVEECPASRGNANMDGNINVLDVMAAVNHILGIAPLTGEALEQADCNVDEQINILDALGIVNVILEIGFCGF